MALTWPRYAFIALFLIAFLVQSAIPAGFMPRFLTGHVFEVTICHGADAKTVLVDKNMNPVKSSQPDCPYATLATKYGAGSVTPYVTLQNFAYVAYALVAVTGIDFTYPKPWTSQGPPSA